MDYCFICIVSIINCYVSILLIYDYFRRNFQPTYSSHCIYIGSAILIGVFIGFVNLLSYPLINFACWIIILTLDICSLFFDQWGGKKRLLSNLFFLIFLLTFFETIGVALYELFVVTVVKHNLPPTADMVFKMAISKVIVIWLYQVGKNTCLTKKQFEHAPKKQLFLYCLLTFFSIINICLNAKINHSTESNIDRFFGYFSIIIVVLVNLYIMKLFDYIIENEKLKNRISLSEQQANLKLKYYKKLDANYQKSLQTLHDVDKHINTLEHLYKSNDFERANRYLESINKLISGFILIPYTTNTVLNIILNEKQVEAQKKDIIFKCSIDNIDFDFMDDIDITTIFSNLIDNAITASATCKALKQIILNVSSHNNFVVINIKNNYTQIIQNEPFSEKHYGIGLYNVENSLKKYEGSLKITCSKNDFECNVVLSNTH